MRRLLLLLAATALLVAACGDDDVFSTTQPGSTTTAAVSTTGSTATTAATTTTGETGTITKSADRRDPALARSPVLSRLSRTGGGGTQLGDKDPGDDLDTPVYGDRGSDPLLDLLWDDCAAGDMGACDELYRQAPLDSEYEEFGDTCSGTTDGGTWCETVVDVSDPYLYEVYDACHDGDMSACDTLYLESPAGSHFAWFGYTCGLISDGAVWCVELIPDETNQRLDDLYAACEGGDMQACDDLYLESPEGSDYEEFGRTCGNRTDGSRWCVDEAGTGTVSTYGDDPYLDGLWDDCSAGDMTACDALYQESPVGSEYETFGDTCGYLTSGGTWCVEIDPGTAESACGDPALDALFAACDGGDWAACDDLYRQSPVDSDCESFGDTCAYTTEGGVWCVDFYEGSTSACGDPALDDLYVSCNSGDWQACDDLYRQSPAGSECEAFGNTCAYTTDGSQWCVDAYASASACGDPTLDALYDACSGGDWQACDDLFNQAPVGSECEDYGNTCAYTTDGSQWCVDAYGG